MRLFLRLAWLLFIAGCTFSSTPVLYKNGVEYVPRPLGLDDRYSFRFVERWRIRFSWLSGAPEVHECHFGKNPFKGKAEYGELAVEDNAPHWEWRNSILGPSIGDRKPFLNMLMVWVSGDLASPDDVVTLGGKRDNGEVNYVDYCSASLSESFTSAAATIVNAKMYKDAESLVRGAHDIRVGSNQWKVVKNPLSDYSGKDYGNQPLLETWILEIPETNYWMIFRFYASKQFSYVERREAYEKAHDLFRQAISSVSLEPITSLVDQEKIIRPEQCVRLHPISPWMCPFNQASILKQ